MSRSLHHVGPLVAVLLAGCGTEVPFAPYSHADPTGSPIALDARGGPGGSFCEDACFLPGMTVIHRGDMPVEEQSAPFTLIHGLLDFQPETWFPAHGHGGHTLYTLVEGSVTVHENGSQTVYGPGESYHHEPGQILAAGNLGDTRSIMAVAFVLPEGEDMITFHDSEHAGPELPPPGMLHNLAVGPVEPGSAFTVTQLVIDVEPGTWTPVHPHPGPSLVTVLEGAVTLRIPGQGDEVFASGDGWTQEPGQRAVLGNGGAENARLVGTYLVPDGKTLTEPNPGR